MKTIRITVYQCEFCHRTKRKRRADHRSAVKELCGALEAAILYVNGNSTLSKSIRERTRAVLAKYKEASDEDNA